MNQFEQDLANGKIAEEIVMNFLTKALGDAALIENVSDQPDCYYKGDIRVTDGDAAIYIEVKNDGVIYRTQKVFCEEKVMRHTSGTIGKGDMSKEHTLMAIVSVPEKRIYFLRSNVLRGNYKAYGKKVEVQHPEENSTVIGYVVPLEKLSKLGGIFGIVNYETGKRVELVRLPPVENWEIFAD